MVVHIAFHPPEETLFSKTVIAIKETCDDLFGDVSKVEFSNEEFREVVVSVQTPLMDSDEDLEKFFSNLRSVFVSLSHLSPHFTHFEEPGL